MAEQEPLTFYLYASEAETGLWCPVCAKPSGVMYSADMLGDSGVLPDAIRLANCEDCGARLNPRPHDA